MAPQAGLAQHVAGEHVGRGAQRDVGVQHARGEPLVELRLVARDAEVPERALRLVEREREGPCGGTRIVVLLRKRTRRLATRRDPGRERQAHEAAWRQRVEIPLRFLLAG